jgi:hypothetical protein
VIATPPLLLEQISAVSCGLRSVRPVQPVGADGDFVAGDAAPESRSSAGAH